MLDTDVAAASLSCELARSQLAVLSRLIIRRSVRRRHSTLAD